MECSQDTEAGQRSFPTTTWGEVLSSHGTARESAKHFMGQLIRRYWHPVYFFIRHRGRSREEAKDLTQGFFAYVVGRNILSYADQSRGRFRNFILAAVKQYLTQEHRKDTRRQKHVNSHGSSLDLDGWQDADTRGSDRPDSTFIRNWAKEVLNNCIGQLEQECLDEGMDVRFKLFRARFLEARDPDAKTLAEEHGITVDDVANHIRWARRRLRRILRQEMRAQIESPNEAEEEVVELLGLLNA